MSETICQYCYESSAPREQFYETKLYRVVVARKSFNDGHAIIVPKQHDPHFYSLSLDAIEEFGYLVKKVSFWCMRLTMSTGFSMVMNDVTTNTAEQSAHLEIHILPRRPNDPHFTSMESLAAEVSQVLDDMAVDKAVKEMRNLMQLPQV